MGLETSFHLGKCLKSEDFCTSRFRGNQQGTNSSTHIIANFKITFYNNTTTVQKNQTKQSNRLKLQTEIPPKKAPGNQSRESKAPEQPWTQGLYGFTPCNRMQTIENKKEPQRLKPGFSDSDTLHFESHRHHQHRHVSYGETLRLASLIFCHCPINKKKGRWLFYANHQEQHSATRSAIRVQRRGSTGDT